ncbi:MAG: histidine--tRNA ligase [Planctomycetota bacterium]|nr:histidine--tRNA ligase [Planctomycetota bacterium]
MSTKPPSGMRDFLPEAVNKRKYVIDVIERVYKLHGFVPLETPSMENLSVLLGKYGEEGDQLVYRLLHRGDKLNRALESEGINENDLAELGMRYDLTVPLARVVAQHRNDLPRYFKRYQIQPVWRADRPAKGRFREFFQCDADITGTVSLMAEADVLNAVATILNELGFKNCQLDLNHRGLLRGMILAAEIDVELEGTTLTALDKLDKIGEEGVVDEMQEKGISKESAQKLLSLAGGSAGASDEEILARLRSEIREGEGAEALDDLENLLHLCSDTPAGNMLTLAPQLARGLSYYTGPIFEITSSDFRGSLGGGGRYDNLIGMFGKQQIPAVGFSIGLERILLLMDDLGLYPDIEACAQVLICSLKGTPLGGVISLAGQLRQRGIAVEIYPDQHKLGRQIGYADEGRIPFVIIVGEEEIQNQRYALKELASGEQEALDVDGLIERLG